MITATTHAISVDFIQLTLLFYKDVASILLEEKPALDAINELASIFYEEMEKLDIDIISDDFIDWCTQMGLIPLAEEINEVRAGFYTCKDDIVVLRQLNDECISISREMLALVL